MQNTFPNYPKILPEMRQKGDFLVDEIIKVVFEKNKMAEFRALLNELRCNEGILGITKKHDFFNDFPAEMCTYFLNFFSEFITFPPQFDQKKIQQGQAFFAQYMPALLSMLGYLSLPYCYAGADGARVLDFSERLGNDTQKRLLETAQFVIDVTQKDAFLPENKGLVSILKVRFMHAIVRARLIHLPEWNMDWGIPINQEDMAGTNLAFSWICVRGLRALGYDIDNTQTENFLHLWAYIGHCLGLGNDLLPLTAKSAYWLDNSIATRQFHPAPHTLKLTKILLETLSSQSKQIPPIMVPSLVRYLLGDKLADMLGIENSMLARMPFGVLMQNQNIDAKNLQKILKDLFEKEQIEVKL